MEFTMRVLSQCVALMRVRFIGVAGALAVAVALAATMTVVAEPVTDVECTVTSLRAKAPKDTTVASAKLVPSSGNLPEFCEVEGSVATPGNDVGFRLALPAGWNRKFYFQGIGG